MPPRILNLGLSTPRRVPIIAVIALVILLAIYSGYSQVNISGGASNVSQLAGNSIATGAGASNTGTMRIIPSTDSSIAATQSGTWTFQPGNTTNTTPWLVKSIPPNGCTAAYTQVEYQVAQVATSAGTSVTSTTTCILTAYVNNITNSNVTFQLQDKSATPIIWSGGANNFTIPPNSSMALNLNGLKFNSGITAIAGTASALNLDILGVQ